MQPHYAQSKLLSELPLTSSGKSSGGAQKGNDEVTRDTDDHATVSALIEQIMSGQGWHNAVIRLIAHWVGVGWSDQEILLAAKAFTLAGWTWEQTRDEVLKAIHGARSKWGRPDNDPAIGGDSKGKSGSGTRTLPIMHFHEASPRFNADDFVQGLLTRRSMAAFYGDSGSGKTFCVTDLCFHVAAGWAWRGRTADRGFVLYIAGEGVYGISNRIAAWRLHYGLADDTRLPFVVVTTGVNLLVAEAGDVEAVLATCKAAAAEYGIAPTMVVMDTLASAMGGGNENASEDMSAVLTAGRRILEELGACFMWIHHSGKDAARGARGHSSFRAALDTEIEVTDKDGDRTATVTKQRDMAREGIFKFRLEQVELGQDRRGNMVTSCVVEHLDVDADRTPGQRTSGRTKRGASEARALEILENAINKQGEIWAGGGADMPANVRSIPAEWWRDQFFFGAEPGATPAAKRVAFSRASKKLVEQHVVGMANGRVWLVQKK